MNNILHIIFIFSCFEALKIVHRKPKILIVPNIESSIVPFQLKPECLHDTTTTYSLEISCTQNVIKSFKKTSLVEIICGGHSLSFTLANLTLFLNKLSLEIVNFKDQDEFVINYFLTFRDKDNILIREIIDQKLEVIAKIPTLIENNQFLYKHTKEDDFRLNVLKIESLYFYFEFTGFEVKVVKNQKPDWLSYSIHYDELFFFGNLPENFTENLEFGYVLYDDITKLQSDVYPFKIINGNKLEKKNSQIHIYIIIVVVILLVIFLVLGIVFYFKYKKAKLLKAGKKADPKKSSRRTPRFENTENSKEQAKIEMNFEKRNSDFPTLENLDKIDKKFNSDFGYAKFNEE